MSALSLNPTGAMLMRPAVDERDPVSVFGFAATLCYTFYYPQALRTPHILIVRALVITTATRPLPATEALWRLVFSVLDHQT